MDNPLFEVFLNEETGRVNIIIPCNNVSECQEGMLNQFRIYLKEEGIVVDEIDLRPHPRTIDPKDFQHLLIREVQNG